MLKINNFATTMPNNIYVDKKVINNKNNSSETLKVASDEVTFERPNQKIDESKFEKIENGILDAVIEGENLYENVLQSIDKFLVNLTNSYLKEKAQIESNLIGEEKNKALESLNKRFDNTVRDYASSFNRKQYTGTLMKVNEDLIKGIENISQKAKEYIDKGNKPPTNMEEYKKFSDYVSQNSTDDPNHISLDALSKFDKIALNMENDGLYFEDFNEFVDKTDLPENLKNILKEANYMNLNDPFQDGRAIANGANIEDVLKEASERKKYFDSLLSSKTERQEKAENERNNNNNELINQMLNNLNSENRLNNSIFSGIKTSSQKYAEFIKEKNTKL